MLRGALRGRKDCAYWLVLLVMVSCVPAVAAAQEHDQEPAPAVLDATQWRTGLVKLLPGWREHEGDDLAWAAPDFDDSGWKRIDLDDLGAAQPGWRWYRLHVKLKPGHDHLHLLFAGGEGTYELYIDGVRQDGPGLRSLFGVKRPTEQVYSLDDETDLVLALRTHATPTYTGWYLPLFLTASVGTPGAIENLRASMESERLYAALPSIAINVLLMLAAFGAFALYRAQRRHSEYLWLGSYLLLLGLSNVLLYCATNGLIPLVYNNLIADPLIYLFTIMQIQFTFAFAGQRVMRAWRVYEWALLSPIAISMMVTTGLVPGSRYVLVEAAAILPAALLLPVLLLVWYRRGNREAGWLILPSLLPAATAAIFDLGSASIFTGWGKLDWLTDPIRVGPIPLQISDVGDLLFVLAIAVVMFFRFTKVSREQARITAELTAAREIQRKLVPETSPEIEGYQVEAAYFPADEVGGDFYQVIGTHDGGTMVVVGDVSGKGLKAAMTGTLAMGALRVLASEGLGPGAILTRLNGQLAEMRHEGFVTCLCARIAAQGEVTMANAGHLPPYWNGKEMLLEPGLPLCLAEEASYAECAFRLEEGDRLTLLSDGVAEARDARGELFGFERAQAISGETANAIAEAALKFGQVDDITVLTLTRMAGVTVSAEMRAGASARAGAS